MMTLILDTPFTLGDMTVAALSRQHISPAHAKTRVSFACTKSPVAILFLRGDTCAAADLSGNVLNAEEIDARYPGMLEKFKNAT